MTNHSSRSRGQTVQLLHVQLHIANEEACRQQQARDDGNHYEAHRVVVDVVAQRFEQVLHTLSYGFLNVVQK